jgi:hypothetical protein
MEPEEQKQRPNDRPDDLFEQQQEHNSARILNNNQQEFERPLLGVPRNVGSQQLIQSVGSANEERKAQIEEERKSEAPRSAKQSHARSSQTSQTEKVSMHQSFQFEEVEPIHADPLNSSESGESAAESELSSGDAISFKDLSQPESTGSKSDCDEIPSEHPEGFTHHEYMRRYALRVVTITHSHDSHGLFDFEKRQGTRESLLTSKPGFFIRKDLNCKLVEPGTIIADAFDKQAQLLFEIQNLRNRFILRTPIAYQLLHAKDDEHRK